MQNTRSDWVASSGVIINDNVLGKDVIISGFDSHWDSLYFLPCVKLNKSKLDERKKEYLESKVLGILVNNNDEISKKTLISEFDSH